MAKKLSEGVKQQKLLDAGILDKLGSGKDNPLELEGTETIFVKYMGILVTKLQENLNKEKSVGNGLTSSSIGTGALSESIRFEYTKTEKSYHGQVFMLDYADYVDQGVKGINGAKPTNSKSPYQFKTRIPGKSMRDSLLIWIRRKNIFDKGASPIGLLREGTRKALATKVNKNRLVMALGIGIKMNGTDATFFKSVAVASVLEEMKAALAKAAASDISINIQTSLLY